MKQRQNLFIELWTAALRSGEFDQGSDTLGSVGNSVELYSCLGVACEVFNRMCESEQAGLTKANKLRRLEQDGLILFDNETNLLPMRMFVLLDLKSLNPLELYSSTKTFKEIAKQLEPYKLFNGRSKHEKQG